MNDEIQNVLNALKRNVNNLYVSEKDDKKVYWKNVISYDIDRLKKLLEDRLL